MLVQQASKLKDEIMKLKKEKDVVILAHNYQIPDVQDVADFTGDSLGLSKQAAKVEQKTILFCGVTFMAETAAIISPEKKVLLPDLEAGCSLSDSITVDELRNWKKQHPGAIVVGYVNTTAEIKAELDYCCTSSNAVNVVNTIPEDKEILFLPDMFLGSYVAKMTGRKNMRIWAGECHVHAGITPEDINKKLDSMKDAEFVIHPECGCTTSMIYDVADGSYDNKKVSILSTEGMLKHIHESKSKNFVVATETGILYRMRKQNPGKTFIPASEKAECQYMKMITLEKVYDALVNERYLVTVPKEIADKARLAINRMLEIK
ncbi:quinolinate synthase NadA [Marine Group I thaumarchaeote]|uniref:Quinolinate synthase n=1 Tax=Marine Group I thaumarchaeote TaxID=2511932 RepID=A0A7K4M853_9ARCH|nr:MAG: quinolinate synthase NadA [Nitrosopumilus sp. YT1]NMI82019.1 quinolinate synthase NadA [Candidatus Nitrosopumilus sp. MTA1]NWJ20236.1 quinolinate synthase NadA [Marine Group I thaumarchaeote]NWJ28570.1 quinolinate synthase NadA [Marine Group I thaumarchaeote]NWJ57147.1 quinolinate synthase NadA [Marine Group I thaumarchaeote]